MKIGIVNLKKLKILFNPTKSLYKMEVSIPMGAKINIKQLPKRINLIFEIGIF